MRSISESVQHRRYQAGARDTRNNPADAWADPVTLGIYAFNPGTSDEPVSAGYDRAITRPAIYLPTGTLIRHRDRIIRSGVTYEVDGDLLDYRNPFDPSMNGCQVNLKVVTP
jgi:hypothetical protein